MNKKSEEIRIRYLYRSLILKGKLRLPLESAKKLIGPDCAYHLYGRADMHDLSGTATVIARNCYKKNRL
jgi:hypothetical protein